MRKLALLMGVAAVLSACAEANTPSRPWQGFATHRESGRLEWFFGTYASRADCLHDMGHQLGGTINATWYRQPMGCAYAGYQNPYVIYLVNVALGAHGLGCVARHTSRALQEAGLFYGPVLKGYPERGESYYCVLRF